MGNSLFLSLILCGLVSAAEIQPLLLDLNSLAALQPDSAEYKHLIKEADKIARRSPRCVTEKKTAPPSGDKRDYVSLAPYWFPDPSKPDGLPYLRKDGKVNPESEADNDSDRFADLAEDVLLMAKAYHLGRDERHAAGVARHLRAFFLDPLTGMNPNVQFGQLVRGRTEVRGEGILECRQHMEIIDALRLIDRSSAWTPADRDAMNRWYERYLHWLDTSPQGADERQAKNNHGTWFAAQYATLALHLGRTDQACAVVEQVKQRIAWQIEPDGSMPLELARTKSLDYSIFNLRALFHLATLGESLDVDLWGFQTPDGRSIRKALDHLAPYADPKMKWPHKQITRDKRYQLLPLLRQSARVYNEPRFADLAWRFSSSYD